MLLHGSWKKTHPNRFLPGILAYTGTTKRSEIGTHDPPVGKRSQAYDAEPGVSIMTTNQGNRTKSLEDPHSDRNTNEIKPLADGR
jgi:hypothetical protein